MTNFEKIRKMSAEELGYHLETILNCDHLRCQSCEGCMLSTVNWRKQTIENWLEADAES